MRTPHVPVGQVSSVLNRWLQISSGLAGLSVGCGAHACRSRSRSLFAKCRFGVDTIDLWTLDVEGGELSVLETVDFERLRVGVLVVETDGALLAGSGS